MFCRYFACAACIVCWMASAVRADPAVAPPTESVVVEWDEAHERASVTVGADAVHELDKLDVEPQRVEAITINQAGTNVPDLTPLKRFPSLARLKIWFVPIDDDALPVIQELKTLKALDLSGTLISDKGVADNLSRCSFLRHLCLRSTNVSNASLPFLARLTNLQSLALPVRVRSPWKHAPFGAEGFSHLTALKSLEELDLSGLVLYDQDILTLAEFPALRRIRLNPAADIVTVEGLYALKERAPRITVGYEILRRQRGKVVANEHGEIVGIADCTVDHLRHVLKVETLDSVASLSLCEHPPRDLPDALPALRKLTLRDVTVDRDTIATICRFRSLRECQFQSCTFDATAAELQPLLDLKLYKLSGLSQSGDSKH